MSPPANKSARERILETAHDLFYREGVRATGVDRLIAEAGVTKVTFYRHFRAKDDLVRAFLDYRHERWMRWFRDALARHRERQSDDERQRAPLAPLALAVGEWFADPSFRGCAFINCVAEIGGALPDTLAIAARHKADMTEAIKSLLPEDSEDRSFVAAVAALAVDGAIVRAQSAEGATNGTIETLLRLFEALTVRGAANEP